jgi:EAL domain-containing protein (putative c-di-GMP-specific phosphodiesterase class I)
LDDFGTGYNSLINMVQFPADYIKIDKIFIDHIMDFTYRLAIDYIIDIAHKIKKCVIAEGVERKEQLDILRDLGCDYIQGYYLSKPLSADELMNFIKLRQTATVSAQPILK